MAYKRTEKETKKKHISQHFFGSANIVTTKNNNLILEISINADDLFRALENEISNKEITDYSSYKTEDGKLFVKFKGIPLKEPKDFKSHFVILDYYKPDAQIGDTSDDDLPF